MNTTGWIAFTLYTIGVSIMWAALVHISKHWRERPGPEDDIHYGIGTGWTYDREGSR